MIVEFIGEIIFELIGEGIHCFVQNKNVNKIPRLFILSLVYIAFISLFVFMTIEIWNESHSIIGLLVLGILDIFLISAYLYRVYRVIKE